MNERRAIERTLFEKESRRAWHPWFAVAVAALYGLACGPSDSEVPVLPGSEVTPSVDADGGGVDAVDAVGAVDPSTTAPPLERRSRPSNTTCLALPAASAAPAATLSETGCVDPGAPTLPAQGLIAYGVNAPLWSDGATKRRWLALPDGATIHVNADGDFDLPRGTVLLKEFSVAGRRVETRLFMRYDDGNWGGYSYRWDATETTASLVPAGGATITTPAAWTIPSRTQCLGCHTAQAGYSLGLEVGQLNGIFTEPNGTRKNSLETFDSMGLFDAPIGSVTKLTSFASPADTSAPVDARARAYLHANCSGCHRPPSGPYGGRLDLRFGTPLSLMGACNVAPTASPSGARLIKPGSPGGSVISLRMHATSAQRMPPLRTVVDTEGVGVVDGWITALTGCL